MSALADIVGAISRAKPATQRDEALLAEGRDLLAGDRTLSVSDVAEMLGVSSPTTIRNWLEKGVFPGTDRTLGGHRRFRLEDVLAVKVRMELTRLENQSGSVLIPDFGDRDPYAGH